MALHWEHLGNNRTTVFWPAVIDGERVVIERSRRDVNREIVRGVLTSTVCADCGEDDPIVLQFDHRVPADKSFNIGQAYSSVHPRDLIDEIEKCDVRCANCHVRRTATQFNWWRLDF